MAPTTIKIDDVEYVRADVATLLAAQVDGLAFVLVRGDRSGVFVGYQKSRNGREVELVNCRRVWYWDGAASVSQLAQTGTSKPQNCKWPRAFAHGIILDAIEVLTVTAMAKETFDKVDIWQA